MLFFTKVARCRVNRFCKTRGRNWKNAFATHIFISPLLLKVYGIQAVADSLVRHTMMLLFFSRSTNGVISVVFSVISVADGTAVATAEADGCFEVAAILVSQLT